MTFWIFLHLLGVTVWVGGMFFAYVALRPAAAQLLEPPQRLPLWAGTFGRFFPWVWVSVLFILVSGLGLIMLRGGFAALPVYVHAMFALGLVMMLIFTHVFFAPYPRLKRFSAAQDWKAAAAALAQIRILVGVNLSIGLLVILIATVGRAFA
jgi:uncharacterized membrane protein